MSPELTERVATLEAREKSNYTLLTELRRDVKAIWWKVAFIAGALTVAGSVLDRMIGGKL